MDRDQWLIYQPEKVQAAYRALEALGWQALVGLLNMKLEQGYFAGSEVEVAKLAEIAQKQAQVRKEYGNGRRKEKPDDEMIHASMLVDILEWRMTDPTHERGRNWELALSDLLASMKYLDQRVSEAGISGDGWHREMVRGE